MLSWTMLMLLVYAMLLTILGEQHMFWKGELFRLLVMIVMAHLAGMLTEKFLRLPALLGMMLTGMLLRNVGFYHPNTGKFSLLTRTMKQMATTVGMVRAGMRLVPDAIYVALHCHHGLRLAGLGMVPSFIEAMATSVVAYFALGFPSIWAVCLGFLLCPNSPSVITPPMAELMELGYGEEKNIGALVHGAAGLDVAFSVSVFDICLAMLFHENEMNPANTVAFGSMDVCMDLLGGFFLGVIAGLLPIQDNSLAVWKRVVALFTGGMIAIVSGPKVGFPGTGPLSCICTAFIASMLWKLKAPLSCKRKINDIIQGFWVVLCPMLFAFTGSDLDLHSDYIKPHIWFWIIGIVLLTVVMRLLGCVLVLWGSDFNWKEMLFIGLIFQGKATNQAALAPHILYGALDSQYKNNAEVMQFVHQSVAMAATSILICTPLSHLGAKLGGPCLLAREERRLRTQTMSTRNDHSGQSA